jgi:hypothetical protein
MTEFGKYHPTNDEHTSSLFSYGEVPLASVKLNVWNGNIQAAIDFLTEAAVTLMGGWSSDFLLTGLSSEPLKVVAQAVPDMTVSVNPGRCIAAKYLAGIDGSQTLPETGSIVAPTSDDRIDIVVIERTGHLIIVEGEEGDPPTAPTIPENTLKLAEIYLRPESTCVKDNDDSTNGYITDTRPALLTGRAHRHGTDHVPSEDPDGSRLNFSTGSVFLSGTLQVFLNGILQRAGASEDYTEDSDRNGYTFNSPPKTGDTLQHFYLEE